MRVKIWGARGSLPSPSLPAEVEKQTHAILKEFVGRGLQKESDIGPFLESLPRHQLGGYGGNTPCIEVMAGDQQIIIDGGSGIRQLSYDLMKGPCGKGKGQVHIFFTHFHWDHLIGLPFFTPIFIPGNEIHVYAVQKDLPEVFKTVFKKPYFPVPLSQLGAKIVYHELEARKPYRLGDVSITPYALDHPDPCWGFRIEHGGKAFAHCVDTEATRVSVEQLGADIGLYQNIDLMIFDAQYSLVETIEKVNWGHAAATIGIDIAMREGVKRVLFMHHDPSSAADRIAAAEAQTRKYYNMQLKAFAKTGEKAHAVDWSFAHEGLSVEV